MSDESGRSDQDGKQGPSFPAAGLREDQIVNAVAFLSHPKVRGSPSASKRSFLEQKELTEAEINEAFSRVPETSAPSTGAAAPAVDRLDAVHGQLAQGSPQPQKHQHQQKAQPVRWGQVALGTGFVGASAYAAKSLAWPLLRDKYNAWKSGQTDDVNPSGSDGPAISSSVTDVAAVAEAIRAQTAELAASIAAIKQLAEGLQSTQRASSPEEHLTVSDLRQELRSFATSLNDIAAGSTPGPATGGVVSPGGALSVEAELAEIKTLLAEYVKTPRSGALGGQTPKGEAQGATPASYRSASEQLPSATSSPVQLPAPSRNRLADGFEAAIHDAESAVRDVQKDESHPQNPPASYMEVLEMLERGETPPGIRSDINDKPPNPNQAPPPARMRPRAKPWEHQTPEPTTKTDGNENGAPEGQGSDSISLSPVAANSRDQSLVQRAEDDVAPSQTESAVDGPASMVSSQLGSPLKTLADSVRRKPPSLFEATSAPDAAAGIVAYRSSPRDVEAALSSPSFSKQIRGMPGASAAASASMQHEHALDHAAENNAAALSDMSSTKTMGIPDGNGLGRPSSHGWRPPPIPLPTLSGGSISREKTPRSGSASAFDEENGTI